MRHSHIETVGIPKISGVSIVGPLLEIGMHLQVNRADMSQHVADAFSK